MSAYAKIGDHVVLALTLAEAQALLKLVEYGVSWRMATADKLGNSVQLAAEERAVRALETSCQPGSRSGAEFK